ncbi:MAG: cephalosporin hydroxylase family protein [Gammaproteobacteria bacterium]|nr:cephalosporin hydroxylase family protein [Gammaproteobacteria bacterium]
MNRDLNQEFVDECQERITEYPGSDLAKSAHEFMKASTLPKYSYNFRWLDRPIIQYPQDIVAMQEIIWQVKPDLIIETGIAHGGSLIFSASMLAMIDYAEAVENGEILDPKSSKRKVLGIDIDLREHNRASIEANPFSHMIQTVVGSSVSDNIINEVKSIASSYSNILVCLDSNHTHEHVLKELEAYASLTSVGSYCVVFDSMIEDLPDELFPDRPWCKGNNPKSALKQWIASHPEFVIDKNIDDKLLISVVSEGYLKRVK